MVRFLIVLLFLGLCDAQQSRGASQQNRGASQQNRGASQQNRGASQQNRGASQQNRGGARRQQRRERNCPTIGQYAICNMYANRNKPSNINGTIYFFQRTNSDCSHDFLNVQVNIDNVPVTDGTAKHGFHVHEFGDMSGGCESMGGHYNPYNSPHGYRWNPPNKRHVGDLGNVLQQPRTGNINMRIVDYLASITGPNNIIGRGIVLHAGEDDLGRVENDTGSVRTGNAGGRLACCVIARSSSIDPNVFSLYR